MMNQTEKIVLNCEACGAQVPIVAEVCPKCGKPTQGGVAMANADVGSPASATVENVDPGIEPKGFAAICGSLLMAVGLLMLLAAFGDLFRPGMFLSGSKAMTIGGIVLGAVLTAVGVAVRKSR